MSSREHNSSHRWELIALIAILALAAALRLWNLDAAPPGLTHDEASNGYDAAGVLRGVRPIYFTVGYGHEPLYPYSVALVMALLGPTDTALRLTTVIWGLIVILLSYGLARRLFDLPTALSTAAWMAVSFWCVMTSRVGLRAITSTATFAASAYCFWRGFSNSYARPADGRSRRWLWWSLSGICLGASIYTYMASRAMPAVYVLFLGYLFVLELRRKSSKTVALQPEELGSDSWNKYMSRSRPKSAKTDSASSRIEEGGALLRKQGAGILVLLLIAALVAAPLVHYLMTHPDAEQRIDQLSSPLQDALRGDFAALGNRLARSLPMFTLQGDPLWLYNIPGRPLLDVPGGAFFYAGLLVSLWHVRDPRHAFLLLWLTVGIGPALATGPDATTLRSMAAQPAVFIIASLGLVTIVRFLYRSTGLWGRIVTIGAVTILFAVTGIRTAQAYFGVWSQHRDVRVAYHHALVEQAHYLDSQPEGGEVSLSSIYPGRFHDPYSMEISLHRNDLSLRWFDGRFAIVFPDEGESRMIIPSIAQLDERLDPLLKPHASLIHTEHFRPDDLVTHFDVYRVDGDSALAALLPAVKDSLVFWSPSDAFPVSDPQSVYRSLDLPINVGDVVDLMGYDLQKPTVGPGEEIELLTVWRIRDTLTREAVAFTHVLNHEGHVIGQMDRLDVPSWHWETGDVFVQLHRFPIPVETSPGLYPVEVGLYTREDSQRLPVIVEDTAVDDRILLRPLEVAGQ